MGGAVGKSNEQVYRSCSKASKNVCSSLAIALIPHYKLFQLKKKKKYLEILK